ncbi:MAG: InlB B-repeat-containing protein [Christensenellales bacterium]
MRRGKLIIVFAIIALLVFSLMACDKDPEEPVKLTISFETNGGGDIADIVIEQGAKDFEMPSNPTKSEYIFDGWYLDNEFKTAATVTSILAALEGKTQITVYAKWKPAAYSISFDTDGGSTVADILLDSETETFELPAAPQKAGYVFAGWYLDDDTEATVENILEALKDDPTITVYAKWNETPIDDAKAALKDGFILFYEEVIAKNSPVRPTLVDDDFISGLEDNGVAEIYSREANGEDIKDFEGADEKLDKLRSQILWERHYRLHAAESIVHIWEQINDGEPLENFNDELSEIEEYYGFSLDRMHEVEEFLNRFEQGELEQLDHEDAEQLLYYEKILTVYINFKEFEKTIDQFLENLEDEIRSLKLIKMATYLLDYDYETFMLEKTYEWSDETRYEVDPTLIPSLIVGLIEESEFTTDDTGMFLYTLLNTVTEGAEDFLAEIRDVISLEFITDFSEIAFGLVSTVEDLKTLVTVHDIVEGNEGSPTIPEIATMVSAIKNTLDEFIDKYTAHDLQNVYSALVTALENLSQTQYEEAFMVQFILGIPIFPRSGAYTGISNLSAILGILDQSALDAFFTEMEDEEGKTMVVPKIMIGDDKYLLENLAILEAKLINILTNGDPSEYATVYDLIFETFEYFTPILFADEENDEGEIEDNEGLRKMSPILAKAVDNKLNSFGLDDISNTFARIQDIAAMPFITQDNAESSEFDPDQDFENLLITRVLINALDYEESLLKIYNDFVGKDKDGALDIGILLYLLEIDDEKLESFANALTDEDTGLILDNYIEEGELDVFGLIFDILPLLVDSGFNADQELETLLAWALGYAAEIGNELLGMEDFLAIQNDQQLREDMAYLIINTLFNLDKEQGLENVFGLSDALKAIYDEQTEDDFYGVMQAILPIIEQLTQMQDKELFFDIFEELIYNIKEFGETADFLEEFIAINLQKPELDIDPEDQGIDPVMLEYFSKVAVTIFGFGFDIDDPGEYQSVLNIINDAPESNILAKILVVASEYYSKVKYIATYDGSDIGALPKQEDCEENSPEWELWEYYINPLTEELLPYRDFLISFFSQE